MVQENETITYDSHGNGWAYTIRFPDGGTVWLQDEDAARLGADLDGCRTDRDEQHVLDAYSVLVAYHDEEDEIDSGWDDAPDWNAS